MNEDGPERLCDSPKIACEWWVDYVMNVPGCSSGWNEMGAGWVHIMWAVASPDKKYSP